jgi:hypothetical protein
VTYRQRQIMSHVFPYIDVVHSLRPAALLGYRRCLVVKPFNEIVDNLCAVGCVLDADRHPRPYEGDMRCPEPSLGCVWLLQLFSRQRAGNAGKETTKQPGGG